MGTQNTSGTAEKIGTSTLLDFKMPNVDMNAIMDSYKKNLEVLGLMNKMSIEVCNSITKLQSAFIKQMMSDMGSIWEKPGRPADMMAKFNEVTRDTIVKAVGNSKQISDMLISSNNELTATITKRMKDYMSETKNLVHKK